MATDPGGNVIVTGATTGNLDAVTGSGGRDLFITKYTSAGVKSYTKLLGVSLKITIPYSIATDASSNIYVSGSTTGALGGNTLTGTTDLFITKFSSAGATTWTKLLGIAGKICEAYGVAVDSASNVYATGYTNGGLDGNTLAGLQDFFVTKFSTAGVKTWTKQLGVAAATTFGQAVITYTDALSNIVVYVTGYSDGALDGNTKTGLQDYFLTKYDVAGTKTWTKLFGAIANGFPMDAQAFAVVTDSSNNVYVAGFTMGGLDGNVLSGTRDAYVTKYSSAGTRLWTHQVGGAAGTNTYGYAVDVDASGNIYCGGYTNGGLDGNTVNGYQDAFVTKLNSSGVKLWTQQIGIFGYQTWGYALKVDTAGNVYVAGTTDAALDGIGGTAGTSRGFVEKLNSSGVSVWVKKNYGSSDAKSFGVDASGNVYLSGTGYLIKYDSAGAEVWASQVVLPSAGEGMGMAIDRFGHVYLGGYSTITNDGMPNVGSPDLLVTSYNSNGSKNWTKKAGAAGKATFGYGVAVDTLGNVYVTGYTNGGHCRF